MGIANCRHVLKHRRKYHRRKHIAILNSIRNVRFYDIYVEAGKWLLIHYSAHFLFE